MLKLEVLTAEQKDLTDLLKKFSNDFYLVGGTALTLQLGHRRSIDFDLFTEKSFNGDKILKTVKKHYPIEQVLINAKDELTILVHKVKMTWYKYEYKVVVGEKWEDVIKMPDVLTIASMKAFALGKRAKWKDYVDLYFVLKRFSLKEICDKTTKLFGAGLFDEVLLRGQLSYFKDIDYSEQVEYMKGFEVSDNKIKAELAKVASTEWSAG